MSKKPILLVVWLVLLGGLLYGVSHFGSSSINGPDAGDKRPPPPVTVSAAQWPQVIAHAAAPARGNPQTRYTIAEFGDFECPQCGRVRPLIETLLQKYPTQINLIFVHRPFPNIHGWALTTAQAAQIAADQGKFWPMYDALYSHQKDLTALAPLESHKDLPPGALTEYAVQAGLDRAQFEAAMKSRQGRSAVDAASQFADSIHVEVTPTLIVHDNVKNTIMVYTGLIPTDKSYITPNTLYFDRDFLERLPWLSAAQPR